MHSCTRNLLSFERQTAKTEGMSNSLANAHVRSCLQPKCKPGSPHRHISNWAGQAHKGAPLRNGLSMSDFMLQKVLWETCLMIVHSQTTRELQFDSANIIKSKQQLLTNANCLFILRSLATFSPHCESQQSSSPLSIC